MENQNNPDKKPIKQPRTYKASIKKNNTIFEVTATSFHELISKIAIIQSSPTKCSKCGSKVYWYYMNGYSERLKRPYFYYGVECTSCGATKLLHLKRRKDKSEYWDKKEKFSNYFDNENKEKSG